MRYKIRLYFFDGTIKDILEEPFYNDEQIPGIVIFQKRAFYGIGRRDKGKVLAYTECVTTEFFA